MLAQPFLLTLWTYHQMQEEARLEAWLDRLRDLRRATQTAMAVNDPALLDREWRALEQDARTAPGAAADDRTAHARGEAIVRRIRRARMTSGSHGH